MARTEEVGKVVAVAVATGESVTVLRTVTLRVMRDASARPLAKLPCTVKKRSLLPDVADRKTTCLFASVNEKFSWSILESDEQI
jgi:hypothetical protein